MNTLIVKSLVVETSGQFLGPLDMGGYEVYSSSTPTTSASLTTKDYVDNTVFGIISGTWSQLQAWRDAGELVTGKQYRNLDGGSNAVTGAERTLIFKAASVSSFEPIAALSFPLPDYGSKKTGNLGVWHAGLTPSVGQHVAWYGWHWVNTSGNVGSAVGVNLSGVDWTKVTDMTDPSYVIAAFSATYSFDTYAALKIVDEYGNEMNDLSLDYCPVGYQGFTGNKITGTSEVYLSNLRGTFFNNVVRDSLIFGTNFTGTFNGNVVESDGTVTLPENSSVTITGCTFDQGTNALFPTIGTFSFNRSQMSASTVTMNPSAGVVFNTGRLSDSSLVVRSGVTGVDLSSSNVISSTLDYQTNSNSSIWNSQVVNSQIVVTATVIATGSVIENINYTFPGTTVVGSTRVDVADPVVVTSTYTASVSDQVIVIPSGTFNLTLPTVTGLAGFELRIHNQGTGTVTLIGTINGVSNYTMSTQYEAVTLYWTGSTWLTAGGGGTTTGLVPYTGATSDVNLGTHTLTTSGLNLPTNPWKLWYTDSTSKFTALSLGASGTVLQSTGAASAPTFTSGLATVSYVDTQDAATLAQAITYTNSATASLKTYVDTQDASVLSQAITYSNSASGSAYNLGVAYTNSASASLVSYVNAQVAAHDTLSEILAGGNSAGANQIDMNFNKIVNLITPTASGDAVTKAYADTLVTNATGSLSSTYVPYTGATNDVALGTHTLTASGVNIASNPWKVWYSDSTSTLKGLSLGASGTFLQSTGTASPPAFATSTTVTDASLTGAGTTGSPLSAVYAKTTATVITQASHGFSVGEVLRLSGAAYVRAQADSAVNAEVVGMVLSVPSASTFAMATIGYVTGLSGLTAGVAYYLSPTVAGAITATQPGTLGQVDKPVFWSDSSTSGFFTNSLRGIAVTSSAAPSTVTEASLISFKVSSDNAPNYLIAGGPSSLTATLTASANAFVYTTNGVTYNLTNDIPFTVTPGLSATNTMLLNEPSWTAASSQEQQSLVFGEKSHESVVMNFDAAGANLQAKFTAGDYGWFKGTNVGASVEFLFGQVVTVGAAVTFRPVWRGVDSANGTTTRIKFRDNDTFTYTQPTYLFVDTNGAGYTSTLLPLFVDTLGTNNGQYYKLASDGLWYLGNGSSAVVTTRVFVGVALSTDAAGCQAVCYLPEFGHVLQRYQAAEAADVDLQIANNPTSTSKGLLLNGTCVVGDQKFVFNNKAISTATAGDRETGTSDISAVGVKYVYISSTGKPYFSDTMPRKWKSGVLMHPSKMWRAVGWFLHSASAFYRFTIGDDNYQFYAEGVSDVLWSSTMANYALFSGYVPAYILMMSTLTNATAGAAASSSAEHWTSTNPAIIIGGNNLNSFESGNFPIFSGFARVKDSGNAGGLVVSKYCRFVL